MALAAVGQLFGAWAWSTRLGCGFGLWLGCEWEAAS